MSARRVRRGGAGLPGRHLRLAFALLVSAAPQAFAQGGAPCWFQHDELNRLSGAQFAAGKPEPDQGFGPACKYVDAQGNITLFVGTTPPDKGMPPDMLRKFLVGPGKAVPIPGDADAAATVQQGGDVPPFPAILYTRKGHTLFLHVTGMWERGYASPAAALKGWNARLAKLPRVPR